jgi:protein-S-isoprenylcysteine O-methyltransferase Ste14
VERQFRLRLNDLTWRDRILLLNSVLFCILGVTLIARFLWGPAPWMAVVLGVLLLAFGLYRLALARREVRKRHHE